MREVKRGALNIYNRESNVATKESVQRILDSIEKITHVPIEKLIENRDWGTLNFEGARRDLETIFSLCAHLAALPLDILPDEVAETFFHHLTAANGPVDRVKQFNLDSGNPAGTRDEIVAQLKDQAKKVLTVTQSWIPFLAYQQGDVQRNIKELTAAADRANVIVNDALTFAETKKIEINGIISAARDASASAGVAVFTFDFETQATEMETDAKTWLLVTASLAGVTLLVAVGSFFLPIGKDATNAQIFQFITSKIVPLVVLLTATLWCGRIFRALKHQAATSRHRGNALKTFQAFVKATSDEVTRNAVLLETTRSIFAIAPSGYLEGSAPPPEANSKIFEIFKGSAAT